MVIAVFRIRITGIGSGSRILQNLLQIWDPGKKGSIVRKMLKITKKSSSSILRVQKERHRIYGSEAVAVR